MFILDKQASGFCVVMHYHSVHQVENHKHKMWEGSHIDQANLLTSVPGYECLPYKPVVRTVWQLFTWFLGAFVRSASCKDMTLYMQLSLFLGVLYVSHRAYLV